MVLMVPTEQMALTEPMGRMEPTALVEAVSRETSPPVGVFLDKARELDPPVRLHQIYNNIQVASPPFDERFTSPLNWALANIGGFCEAFDWSTDYRPEWAKNAGDLNDQSSSEWYDPAGGPQEIADELNELAHLIEYRAGMIGEGLDQRSVIEDYFRGILTYNRQTHPNTSRLVGLAHEASTIGVMRFKLRYMRPRPSQLSPTLLPPIDPPEHGSFPSGHATQSFAIAFMLDHILDGLGVEGEHHSVAPPVDPRDELLRNPFFDMAGACTIQVIVKQVVSWGATSSTRLLEMVIC